MRLDQPVAQHHRPGGAVVPRQPAQAGYVVAGALAWCGVAWWRVAWWRVGLVTGLEVVGARPPAGGGLTHPASRPQAHLASYQPTTNCRPTAPTTPTTRRPTAGDASYEKFMQEKAAELASLRRRAHMVTDGFNSLEGVSCNFTEGAMYSFPQVWCGCCCCFARARVPSWVLLCAAPAPAFWQPTTS